MKLDGGSVWAYPTALEPEVQMNAQPQPTQPNAADRRRLKTETSASNGWAARLQALANLREMQRPSQRPETTPR